MGSTELAIQRIAQAQGWSIELVVTLPAQSASRHSDFVDLSPLAQEAGAQIHHAANVNDADCLSRIAATSSDFIFVIGWSQICRAEFLDIIPGRTIGYHPAALPRLRGRAPLAWTILLDEPITAGSLFWLGKGADDGDLIDQEFFHVARDETARSLYDRHQQALQAMLDRTLKTLASGELPRHPQDERFATWAARRTPADGLINWNDPAHAIDRLVRAVGEPYPGAFTFAGEEKLIISKARALADGDAFHAGPGQIVLRDDHALVVKTGAGLLRIEEWHCPSGRTPHVHSWLRDSPQ